MTKLSALSRTAEECIHPFTIASFDDGATAGGLVPSRLFYQERAMNVQVLAAQRLDAAPHEAGNVFTEVALQLDDSRKKKLTDLLERATETRFSAGRVAVAVVVD